MDEMIYVAMTGAKQTEYAQTINSNNLANVNTTGFRADLHAFSSIPVVLTFARLLLLMVCAYSVCFAPVIAT